jgi:hypothetical protein
MFAEFSKDVVEVGSRILESRVLNAIHSYLTLRQRISMRLSSVL